MRVVHAAAAAVHYRETSMLRVLMILVPLALAIYAFIDCLTTEEKDVRGLPKLAWVFVILLFSVPLPMGSIGWLAAGRPRRVGAAGPGGGLPFGGLRGRPAQAGARPLAPDDDPEFLASLGRPKSVPDEGSGSVPTSLPEDVSGDAPDDGEADAGPRGQQGTPRRREEDPRRREPEVRGDDERPPSAE